ncbi:transglycosylase family protein [Ornithinimicrobium cryptoxanthini]|nr:transglycosylase family protein [Ornithinimicrobium cryptoxanthini]
MPHLHRTTSPAPNQRTARLSARLAGATTLAVVVAGLGAGAAHAAYTPEVWDEVAQCESSGNWQINTGNGYYGGLQFYHPTWKAFGGQEFAGYAHQASKAEQIAIGRRVLHTQGPGAWPVCSVRAGLTRDNGGADPNAQPGDAGEAPAPVTRYVSANEFANVRSGPGTGYNVVDTVPRGTEVTGTMTSNGWLDMGNSRFISGTILSSSPVDGGQAPAPGEVTRYVSASTAANIRSGPSTSYRVVDSAVRGTEVTGTLTSNGWLKIATDRYISGTVLSANPVDGGGTAPAPGEVTRYVSASNAASIRTGPSTSYRLVGSAARGTEVTGTLTSNGWLKIATDRYISGVVLSSTPVDGGAPAPAPGEVTRYVSANYAANVRSGPGNGYSIVGSEARGAKVTGTLTSTGWLNMGSGRYIGPTVLSSSPV